MKICTYGSDKIHFICAVFLHILSSPFSAVLKAQQIIKRAEKGLIRERIRVVNNKIQSLKSKKSQLEEDFNRKIPAESELGKNINQHLATVRETTYANTKRCQLQKLQKLAEKQTTGRKKSPNSTLDLSGTQLKKWVVNLSKYKLNPEQTSVLARGLNFAVSPPEICAKEFVLATELACKHLPQDDRIQLRAKVASTLKSSKVPEQNITKEERKAIKELKQAEDIIILPADKGKSTVVLDKDKYDEQPNTPLRPIVDYTATIGYSTSRWLADILGGLVGNTQHHVKNSKHLAEELAELVIEEDEILNSHDIVSLFTNTPIDQVLDIVKHRLEKESLLRVYNKETGFNLTSEDVVKLLDFILTTTYFTFRGKIYRQLFGTAMGSPVSPIAANIFMEALEQQAITTAPLDCKPKLWLRYVDDILEVVKRNTVQQLTDHINKTDKSDSIKFTYEEESEGTIPFLDTLIVRKEDDTVKLLVYRKPTHTDST
ncbi:uncharacterized protein [Amphiura filiformis]|uniref:uncharacterized protein n=1 Tax=Amphiura filiformis TaxID=82378 RepID=UPI003B212AF3